MTRLDRHGIRGDLEGLRGVAVALVVLFHARLLGVGGGFVGVDAFYVLSGFLITGLLLNELELEGTLDLAAFYVRRARRILPAATVAIVATLGVAAFVVAPLDLPEVALDATASALFVSNVHFVSRATDYFASTAPSPFLHFWSLAVEEQFYLVWPVLLLVAARLRRVGEAIAIVLVSSLALALVLTPTNGPWAFYLLPTRAWELALGALLAYGRPGIARVPAVLAAPLGWLGLVMLAVATTAIDETTQYPGIAALVPTCGVALLIASGERRGGPGAFLSLAPLRLLGRISYSVYLYHWPVLTLAAVAAPALPVGARAALVAIAVVVGALSWRLVEEPFRRSRAAPRRSLRSLALAGTAVVVVALVGGGVATSSQAALADQSVTVSVERATIPAPEPPVETRASDLVTPPSAPMEPAPAPAAAGTSELRPRIADARHDGDALVERGCGLSLAGSQPPRCTLGDPDGTITVALVGDSHAAQWSPTFELIAREHGLRLVPFTKDSCIFLDMRIISLHLDREYVECARWRQAVISELTRLRPAAVIVSSSRWVHPVDEADASYARQVDAMARLLRQLPGEVIVLADTPTAGQDVPACLSRQPRAPQMCATPRSYALGAHLLRDRPAAERAGAALIDLSPWICPDDPCAAIVDSTIVYRDDHHLTATFARALAPKLAAALAAAAPSLQNVSR